ncbi:hypothetical protein CYLTODRAFT_487779 [Cylindrobasidium torrendii FP15055 ss-10]|uniref:Uncharacterized protein n=1 Tax=Cylindrobasidium torrendii FP15055 ss-10 TaxID=1314674 RepID=A0A0D7BME2_9AGAR|nr:hypothetical protein CYLTODRAFT_487779 [Cylindrobasidium torrendii FP15055 ss-10]
MTDAKMDVDMDDSGHARYDDEMEPAGVTWSSTQLPVFEMLQHEPSKQPSSSSRTIEDCHEPAFGPCPRDYQPRRRPRRSAGENEEPQARASTAQSKLLNKDALKAMKSHIHQSVQHANAELSRVQPRRQRAFCPYTPPLVKRYPSTPPSSSSTSSSQSSVGLRRSISVTSDTSMDVDSPTFAPRSRGIQKRTSSTPIMASASSKTMPPPTTLARRSSADLAPPRPPKAPSNPDMPPPSVKIDKPRPPAPAKAALAPVEAKNIERPAPKPVEKPTVTTKATGPRPLGMRIMNPMPARRQPASQKPFKTPLVKNPPPPPPPKSPASEDADMSFECDSLDDIDPAAIAAALDAADEKNRKQKSGRRM